MKPSFLSVAVLLLSSLSIVGCDKKQETPTTPTVALTSVDLVSPAANLQIPYASQPVTLTVRNAASTGTAPLTYVFEVASDAAFANKVVTKSVAEGTGGQTS